MIQIITTIPMLFTFIFCYHNYQPDLWYINISRILQLGELFKLQSYQRAMKVISNTILQTYKTFFFLYWFIMLLVLIFGSVVFALERGEFTVNETYPEGTYLRWNVDKTEKEVSPFISLASSMWYALVSITTVGYGDVVPTSVAGRAVGSFLLLISFIVISLPITVLGDAFASAVDRYNAQKSILLSTSKNDNATIKLSSTVEEMGSESLNSQDESYNPLVRRSYNNRLARTLSVRNFIQGIQKQENSQDQEIQQQSEDIQQIQVYNQTIEMYTNQIKITTDERLRKRYEIEMELFLTNQKMKEITNEYNQQMQLCFAYQSDLYIKLQQLVDPTSPPSNPDSSTTTNDNPHPKITTSVRNVFEIQNK